jgi:hypothetical protein
MDFTGLVKGDVTESLISDALSFHGMRSDTVRVTKRTYGRHGTETHFAVDGADDLEKALHAWFQDLCEAPFPTGTLLHFSYVTPTEKVTTTRTYTYPEFLRELEAAELSESGSGEGC